MEWETEPGLNYQYAWGNKYDIQSIPIEMKDGIYTREEIINECLQQIPKDTVFNFNRSFIRIPTARPRAKEYKCNQCDKSFTQSRNRKRHVKVNHK